MNGMAQPSLSIPDSAFSAPPAAPKRGIVVFSGGSAANSLVDVFNEISEQRNSPLSYVIPISDNGGSSSELIRVFGGPGIGDIRSRLIRLIPPTHNHIRNLLNHRLPIDPDAASLDWQSIVSGTSSLWPPISSPARELVRSILIHLNMEILKRARPPHSTFNYSLASVGNLFLTGARIFTGSFESAIYLLTLIGGVSNVAVIPAINSNFSHHISAGLANGDHITGQNAISHPSAPTALNDSQASLYSHPGDPDSEEPHPEDANLPGSLPTLRRPNIHFSKADEEDLPARVERVWYINPYGQEIVPEANPKAVNAVRTAEAVMYSIGSLYTSIVPCLVLRGIGEALSNSVGVRFKVLILNGSLDRESGPSTDPMDAAAFVAAIARAAEESQGRMGEVSKEVWKRYVTHVVYLEGPGVPEADKKALAVAGIESVRCWGRKDGDNFMKFDAKGLSGALEAILGRREWKSERSRRNTLES